MSTATEIKEHLERAHLLLDPAYAPFINRKALLIRIGDLQLQYVKALGLPADVLLTYQPTEPKGT